MKCKYCGNKAGFFKLICNDCKKKNESYIKEIKDYILDNFKDSKVQEYNYLKNELSYKLSKCLIDEKKFNKIVVGLIEEFLLTKPYYIDGFNIKNFIFSLPNNLKNEITNKDFYTDFWGGFFKNFYMSNCNDDNVNKYKLLLQQIRSNTYNANKIDNQLMSVLESKISRSLDVGLLNDEDELEISNTIKRMDLNDSLLTKNDYYQKYCQSLILRDIEEGDFVSRVNVDLEKMPILLSKNEQLCWVFDGVTGYEEKTGKQYVGRSSGVSMRIAKGVYYRVGASRGTSVEYQYQKDLGFGAFFITTKNLYFVGVGSGLTNVKIPISKVLSFIPYSDGIQIVKDGATPKPYLFKGFDPWFVVNAMQLLIK